MKRRTPKFALLVLLPTALLSACAVPLGPGYTVKKQQLEARWTGTPDLAVRGTYRLQNTGKAPLDYIVVTLPPESRRSGLQISLDNSPVATQPADELAPAGTVRIPISPALPLKKKRDLVIEYRLAGSVGDVSATPSFYLETRGWYPALREREGLFGSGGEPPEKWDLRFTVPRDFLVHASGQPKGRKRRGDTVEHRFRQRRGQDFDPFVVAGRFVERQFQSPTIGLRVWALEVPSEQQLRTVGEHIKRTVEHLQNVLGPTANEARTILLASGPPHPRSMGMPIRDVSFHDSVYIEPSLFQGEISVHNLCLHNELLAEVWVRRLSTPDEEAEELSDALASYAAHTAGHECGFGADESRRREFVHGLISLQLGTQQLEQDEVVEQELRVRKKFMFVWALEDRLGRPTVLASIRRMLQALRGQTWTTNDLRVAIQLETGEDPADFFRQWLNQPGIPEEFRKRYEKPREGNRE